MDRVKVFYVSDKKGYQATKEEFLNYKFSHFIKTCKKKPLVLYGAGKNGLRGIELMRQLKIKIDYLCDDDPKKIHSYLSQIEIISLEEAKIKLGKNFNIILTTDKIVQNISNVFNKVKILGMKEDNIYWFDSLFFPDISYNYLLENKNNIELAYQCFVETKSKILFNDILEAKLTKDTAALSYHKEVQQYFPLDIFKFEEDEVFIDAGAFTGDTTEEFLKVINHKYKSIYCFEPDENNYYQLQEKFKDYDSIKTYPNGVYNENITLHFNGGNGVSCYISEEGIEEIQTIFLDDFIKEKVTFIKMDIEGSELAALQGAKNLIKKYKPKLAICVYHKSEDLWKIPLYIKKLVPEYKLYLRTYTNYFMDTVCYATL